MSAAEAILLAISVALFLYVGYAMIKPERF
ncbi:K(+)-transporting ATPase subunit F [Acidimicrobiaceae bacterium USS-CC1]|uniref:K(+)-transporting ATPase subunit F n=1 Tax=Acidiferrimicrobium australe TaxID=2664430 RepID=A0ABW9QNS4_9ACTN|nr:K(+)-transporting ATPase subunit F [Acidiferrimicrobium australe]